MLTKLYREGCPWTLQTTQWVALDEAVKVFLAFTRAESPTTAKSIDDIVALLKATCRTGARCASISVDQFTLVIAGDDERGWKGEVRSLVPVRPAYYLSPNGDKVCGIPVPTGSVPVFPETLGWPVGDEGFEHGKAAGLQVPER